MSSVKFVVGKNDKRRPGDREGPYYPVVHSERCHCAHQIIAKSRHVFFSNYEEALSKATDKRPCEICKSDIEQELGRPLP